MTAPYVIEVKSDSNTGNYYTNTTISIKVIFNTIIEVDIANGSPQLVLDVGNNNTHNATYDGLETTDPSIDPYNDTIVFSYTIQAGHVNTNLNYNDEDSLVLNNATITDSTQTMNANLKLPIPLTLPSEYFFGIPGDGSIDVSGNFGNFDAVFSTQSSNILLNNNYDLADTFQNGDLVFDWDGATPSNQNTTFGEFVNFVDDGGTSSNYSDNQSTPPNTARRAIIFDAGQTTIDNTSYDNSIYIAINELEFELFSDDNNANIWDRLGITAANTVANLDLASNNLNSTFSELSQYLHATTTNFVTYPNSHNPIWCWSEGKMNNAGTDFYSSTEGIGESRYDNTSPSNNTPGWIFPNDITSSGTVGIKFPQSETKKWFKINKRYVKFWWARDESFNDIGWEIFITNSTYIKSLAANQTLNINPPLPPTVTNVTSDLANGSYTIGEEIYIKVVFDQTIVTNIPNAPPASLNCRLSLELFDSNSQAVQVNAPFWDLVTTTNNNDTIRFKYTVAAGQNTSDLDYLNTNSIQLFNNATIENSSGQAADLALFTPGTAGSLSANKAIVIDTTPPTIISATIVANSANQVDVEFSEPVFTDTNQNILAVGDFSLSVITPQNQTVITVQQTPTNIQNQGSNIYRLTFSLSAPPVYDPSTESVYQLALQVASQTSVYDLAGNAHSPIQLMQVPLNQPVTAVFNFEYPIGNSPQTFNSNPVLNINYSVMNMIIKFGQSVSNFTNTDIQVSQAGSGSLGALTDEGQQRKWTGTFTANIPYESWSNGDIYFTLLNTYTVPVGYYPISFDSNNQPTLPNCQFNVDTIEPTVTSVTSTDGLYVLNDDIDINIQFSEIVVVTNTPKLRLDLNVGTPYPEADYVSGSGTNTLTFHYHVEDGDFSNDLAYPTTNSLVNSLNSTIKDNGGNLAILTLPTPGQTGSLDFNQNIFVDGKPPVLTTDISSNNPIPTLAKGLNTIYLRVFSDEPILQPSSTISNANGGSLTNSTTWQYMSLDPNPHWRGSTVVFAGSPQVNYANKDPDGLVSISVIAEDLSGNIMGSAHTTIDSGSVTIDQTPPDISTTNLTSSNTPNSLASDGDTVTLTIVPNEDVTQPSVTFYSGGLSVADQPNIIYNGSGSNWTASYDVDATNDAEGAVTFSINMTDLAGNTATGLTSLTGTSVDIDLTPPSITQTSIESSNTPNTIGYPNNTVTLIIITDEDIVQPSVTFTSGGITVTDQPNIVYNSISASEWQAIYVVNAADTDGDVEIQIDVTDLTGNINATTYIGPIDNGNVVIDTSGPTITSTIASNNNNTTLAKEADTITLTINTNETIIQPSVTFFSGGDAVTDQPNIIYNGSGSNWTASFDVNAADTEGAVSISVTAEDLGGNTSTSTIISGNGVTVDMTPPVFNPISISTNNSNTSIGYPGQTVTLTITTNESLLANPGVIFTIAGGAIQNAPNVTSISSTNFEASFLIDAQDNSGLVGITIVGLDLAGNAVSGNNAVTSTTDGSSVTIDSSPPIISNTSLVSNNVNYTTLATIGNIITLTFTTNENITVPTVNFFSGGVAINGTVNYTPPAGVSTNWTVTYQVNALDTDGPVTISITATDVGGNTTTNYTTISGTNVTVDITPPNFTTTSIVSNNNINTLAKEGEVVTLTIVANESLLNTPTVNFFSGNPAQAITNPNQTNGSGANWTASFDVDAADTEGIVSIQITGTDLAGNTTNNFTTISNGSVTIDMTLPTVSIGTNAFIANSTSNITPVPFTITSNEPTTNLAIGDVIATNGTKSNFQASSTSVYTLDVTPIVDGACSVDISGGSFTDFVGNGNVAATPFNWTFDSVSPSVSIGTNAFVAGSISNVTAVPFTFTTSDPTINFTVGDTIPTNGSITNFVASQTNPNIYSADFAPINNGACAIDISGGSFTDSAGNGNIPATTFNWAFDNVPPVFTSTSIFSDNNVVTLAKEGDVVTLDISSNEILNGAPIVDFYSGTNPPQIITNPNQTTGSDTNWTASFDVDAADTEGPVSITITGTDLAGNTTNNFTTISNGSVVIDMTGPSVVSFTMSNTNISWSETSNVTLEFSEEVADFNSDDDITVQNGSLSTMTLQQNSNVIWEGIFTPTNDIIDSSNVLTLANTYTDIVGNSGSGATTANYQLNTVTPWATIDSPTAPELLWDPAAIVIRFGQIRFDLTGDLSKNRITDLSYNTTRFTELNLDFQNHFSDSAGMIYDISMNCWKNYFYNGLELKPYRRQKFQDMAISEISGNIVFIKDVSNNNAYAYNKVYTTSFFDELKNHIVASKKISSMQHLSSDSLMYLISVFGGANNLNDLCVLFNKKKGFVWEFDGMDLHNLNRVLAMRYDQVNNTTDAMDILNDNDNYPGQSEKWKGIANLFSNPQSVPGNNWKSKTAYFALSLLFWTDETDVDDIEFLLYFRCSATSQITMKMALKENISTSSDPPYISLVSALPGNGTYSSPSIITILVQFNEIVIVSGVPKLKLQTGPNSTTLIDYVSGSNTNVLQFQYNISVGDSSAALDYVNTISLILNNGATIKSSNTNYSANIILPIPGTTGSLSDLTNLVIN